MSPAPSSNHPIGIVAALHQELNGLLALMQDGRCVHLGSREFWVGELDGCPVVLVLSRVGKVAAAATAAALASHFGVGAMVFTGVAVAQVCHEWGVPFAAVRIISDRADDSASVDFPRFITEVESRYSVAILRRWLCQTAGAFARALPHDRTECE